MTVRMTSKGQVTIPKEMRDQFGLKPGDELEFVPKDGVLTVKRHFDEAAFDAAIKKWRGHLKHLEGRTSDELVAEMRDG